MPIEVNLFRLRNANSDKLVVVLCTHILTVIHSSLHGANQHNAVVRFIIYINRYKNVFVLYIYIGIYGIKIME